MGNFHIDADSRSLCSLGNFRKSYIKLYGNSYGDHISSIFLDEAVMEKAMNDKKREIIERARKIMKYYESDGDLTSLSSLDSQDFVD